MSVAFAHRVPRLVNVSSCMLMHVFSTMSDFVLLLNAASKSMGMQLSSSVVFEMKVCMVVV